MLGAFPSVVPRDVYSLWSPIAQAETEEISPPTASSAQDASQQQQQQRRAGKAKTTLHARLRAEEEAVFARDVTIQRYGSTWLRPPGVTKTYQAMMDEELERVEAQLMAQREAERREMEAAAEDEARAAGDEDLNRGEEDMEGMQRDLDDDVPEAADDLGTMEVDDGDEDAFVDNDDDGAFEDDRDLDDDVPEAGSYQHTDTEVEDESSDDERSSIRHPEQEAEEHVTPATGPRQAGTPQSGPQVIQNFQVPLPLPPATPNVIFNTPSEPAADSSMVISSPIAARPPARSPRMQPPRAPERRSRFAARRGENRPSG